VGLWLEMAKVDFSQKSLIAPMQSAFDEKADGVFIGVELGIVAGF
jgi:hypothetical protein